MSDIAISHERMASEAANLKAVRGQLESDLGALRAKIAQLVSDGFVTQSASQSFNEAHERWNSAATSCISELDNMSTYLSKTSEAFAGVDTGYSIK